MSKQFTLITGSSDCDFKLSQYKHHGVVDYYCSEDDSNYRHLNDVAKIFGEIRDCGAFRISAMIQKINVASNKSLMIAFPETFLHPGTQSILVKYLIDQCIEKNIQLFVVTYSEYILNAFRIAIAHKTITSENFEIIFNDQGVPINDKGRIENEYWVE